jgi:hypothetical protein
MEHSDLEGELLDQVDLAHVVIRKFFGFTKKDWFQEPSFDNDVYSTVLYVRANVERLKLLQSYLKILGYKVCYEPYTDAAWRDGYSCIINAYVLSDELIIYLGVRYDSKIGKELLG